MPVEMYCNQWESDDRWRLNSHHEQNIWYNPIVRTTCKRQWILAFYEASLILQWKVMSVRALIAGRFSTKIAY